MNHKLKSLKKYLTFDVICGLIILFLALYFIFTNKKRWYKFQGLENGDIYIADNKKSPLSFSVQTRPGRSTSIKEERTRDILEKIYGKKFPPIRPDFLKNPSTGHNLEIDCYNQELALGIEVDGRQHAEYVPYFHGTNGAFKYQVAKDDYKKKKCQIEGVTLINIPHFVHVDDLERYLRLKLKNVGKLN